MPRWMTFIALGSIVLGAVVVHLWGIAGDLPYPPDIDEPIFMRAAVGMLVHHSLNPSWFGNPGSTVIYPIAALVEIWYQAAKHLPPFAHPIPGIGRELVANPMPFYLIGRLVVATYGIGCVVVTWLLGRRILGDLGGILAALFLPATAIVVAYGQIVRTDTAGLFFALLALWLASRAMELRRPRDWVFAAIAIGLAISSRYFFAILIVPYLVAAVAAVRSMRNESGPEGTSVRSVAEPFVALFAVPLTVVITSPFLLLDFHTVILNLQNENRTVHPGADGLSPIGNVLWYIGTVSPATFGWPDPGRVGDRPRRRRAEPAPGDDGPRGLRRVVPHRGQRITAPLGPLHHPVGPDRRNLHCRRGPGDRIRCGRRPRTSRADPVKTARIGNCSGWSSAWPFVVLLLVPSITQTVAQVRQRSVPSTRAVATDWITKNIPPGSGIASEMAASYLARGPWSRSRCSPWPAARSDRYRADGYRYLGHVLRHG